MIGNHIIPTTPKITMKMEITVESTGRLIKLSNFIIVRIINYTIAVMLFRFSSVLRIGLVYRLYLYTVAHAHAHAFHNHMVAVFQP